MLIMRRPFLVSEFSPVGAAQRGAVLIVTLILLVAMTIGAVGLIRSVDTGNLIAGNLAFQQSATNSADVAVEAAVSWLQSNSSLLNNDSTTNDPTTSNGYFATVVNQNPSSTQKWEAFWNASLAGAAKKLAVNSAGNTVFYVIHRQCAYALPPSQGGNCSASLAVTSATGNTEEAGQVQLNGSSGVYYRITVRVDGPRNTASYVQAVVSL